MPARVQGVLDGCFAMKAKRGVHGFAFSGPIACHACGNNGGRQPRENRRRGQIAEN
ncbi:MAG: hypothetical protein ACLPX9_01125 [Rhodomicrobium sp.]